MGQFYRFYSGQNEIVAQLAQQLYYAYFQQVAIVSQLVPQFQDALVVDADSAPVDAFPYFLGMIPWGHHIEILQSCKDVKEAVFYVEKTMTCIT